MSAPLLFSRNDNPYQWIDQAVCQMCKNELKKFDFPCLKTPSKEVQNTLIQNIKREVQARIDENPEIQAKLKQMPCLPANVENLYTSKILDEVTKYFHQNKK